MGQATSAMGRAQRERLAAEGRRVGPAVVPGRLYDLGGYPGLVDATESTALVHGEVIRLVTPAATLAWLDAYEGVGADGEGEEYRRVTRAVRLSEGAPIEAWLYLFIGRLKGLNEIESGSWAGKR